MKLLLDTCVLSELQRPGGSPAVKSYIALLPGSHLFVSVITLGEIAKGIALLTDSRRKREITQWQLGLSSLFEDRIVSLDQETAELWGELSASGLKRGVTVPVADGLIAATALRNGLHVATRNTPHFEMAGAMVVNPWLSSADTLTQN